MIYASFHWKIACACVAKDKPGYGVVCVHMCSISLSLALALYCPLSLSLCHLELGTKVSCVVCNFNANHMLKCQLVFGQGQSTFTTPTTTCMLARFSYETIDSICCRSHPAPKKA